MNHFVFLKQDHIASIAVILYQALTVHMEIPYNMFFKIVLTSFDPLLLQTHIRLTSKFHEQL